MILSANFRNDMYRIGYMNALYKAAMETCQHCRNGIRKDSQNMHPLKYLEGYSAHEESCSSGAIWSLIETIYKQLDKESKKSVEDCRQPKS